KNEEDVELYQKELKKSSENWDVKLYVAELSKEEEFSEKNTLTIKYLKEIEEEKTFQYELIYGDPPHLAVGPSEHKLTNDGIFEQTDYDQKMMQEIWYSQIALVIYWEDEYGVPMEEEFIFRDE